jgi:hypothetical protein
MASPVYQYVISLVVSLPIRRGPAVLMNVLVQEILLLKNRYFDVAKFTILTPNILPILM